MKKSFRLIALLLALILVMQAAVLAADPPEEPDAAQTETGEQTVKPDPGLELPGEDPSDGETPVEEPPADEPGPGEDPEQPEDPEDPGPAEPVPEPIVITASLEDGQTVHSPDQTLRVGASQGEEALRPDQLRVSLGGEALSGTEGEYALRLALGENKITVTAATDTAEATLSLTLNYRLAIPEGWAHDALAFCVDHGILNGDQNGDLLPERNATRAQLAAMLVRLFDARPAASLAGYSDVPESAWYHDEMARAVAMGIFEGSNGRLNPENSITREQAFTVLARAFGVAAPTTEALAAFPDAGLVSTWAKSSVAGMLEAGYVHGSTSGKLNPGGYITRQELAQVLYNALDCITDDPEALTGSRCLYTGPIEALEGRTVEGDLIVSSNAEGAVALDSLRVSGRLALHLHSAQTASLGPVSDSISLCSPVRLTLTEPVARIACLRDNAFVTGEAEQALLSGGILRGSYGTVTCLGGNCVIASDTSVEEMHFGPNMAGRTLTLYGDVDALHADVRSLTIAENGRIKTLYQYNNSLNSGIVPEETVDRVDAGLEGVQIVQSSISDAYYDLTTVTVTGAITGVNTEQVYGVPDGVRTVNVIYRYGGRVLKTETIQLTDDAELSCEVTPTLRYRAIEEQSVAVTIEYGDDVLQGELKVRANGYYTPYQQALNVQTCKVKAYINYSTGIYGYSSLTGYVGSVSAGSIVHYITTNGVSAKIETSGGLIGWVPVSAVRVSWQKYHNDDVSYSKEVKEAFVNEVHDYSSATNYLIWCNLYTTTVNVFKGYRGHWELIMSGECVIGTPETPTRVGVYTLYSRSYYWSFDDGIRLDNSRCYYASLFDGGIAFHTRLYYTATNTFVNSSLSAEISHGCVRCPDDIAKFIYYQCPLGTKVVVY